jgi:hypothetical protein
MTVPGRLLVLIAITLTVVMASRGSSEALDTPASTTPLQSGQTVTGVVVPDAEWVDFFIDVPAVAPETFGPRFRPEGGRRRERGFR